MVNDYMIKTYNNKSRKGDYYYARYKDIWGKTKTSQIKVDRMTPSEFEDYLSKVKTIKTAKQKRELSKSYISPQKLDKELKRQRVDAKDLEREEIRKDYNLEREQSLNKLVNDVDAKKTLQEYERQEAYIISRVAGKGNLYNMTESEFEAKLKSYMNISGEVRGKKANFLNDIINKWGQEFKQ